MSPYLRKLESAEEKLVREQILPHRSCRIIDSLVYWKPAQESENRVKKSKTEKLASKKEKITKG